MVDVAGQVVLWSSVSSISLPLLSFVLLLLLRAVLPRKGSVLACLLVGFSVASSLVALSFVLAQGSHEYSVDWYVVGGLKVMFGLRIDQLSAMMLAVVSLISFLIHVYSIGYMHGDKRFGWYFAALSLFTASMQGLVSASNYLQMYICWELVGLCSYLLIGFWFEKKSAADAAKKAFIVTRIGDVGFALGVILAFFAIGSTGFTEVFGKAPSLHPNLSTAIGLLFFCGAVGKSAQFPLHVWLPDAMEGPTPVSALIHAATMVAAGVYLVARSFPLFASSNVSMGVVMWVGAFTAIFAATMAVVMTDIKRVLAYSTISQLGYMMAALGAGSYFAGVFHLMTHAFFKALLFLGAGSVIHSAEIQDIRDAGGLWSKMKITAVSFAIGALSLSGFPLLSGFWSKDEILADVLRSSRFVFAVLVLTAFLTAFYMFRVVFRTFFGKKGRAAEHAHESPKVMTIPLCAFSFFAVFFGLIGSPLVPEQFRFSTVFATEFVHGHVAPVNYWVMMLSTLVGLAGIGLAYVVYQLELIPAGWFARKFGFVHRVLVNRYYIDQFYNKAIVGAALAVSRASFWFDMHVVDAFVNLWAQISTAFSRLIDGFDAVVIDGFINGLGRVTLSSGYGLAKTQTGYVLNYALIFFAVVIGLVVWAVMVL